MTEVWQVLQAGDPVELFTRYIPGIVVLGLCFPFYVAWEISE